jgi:hypothetical protein
MGKMTLEDVFTKIFKRPMTSANKCTMMVKMKSASLLEPSLRRISVWYEGVEGPAESWGFGAPAHCYLVRNEDVGILISCLGGEDALLGATNG